MTTIIDMAREVGWKDLRNNDSEMHDHIFMGNIDTIKALVELARAGEREACAKVAEEHMREREGISFGVGAAIRARGNT